jgi:hypothetical protein
VIRGSRSLPDVVIPEADRTIFYRFCEPAVEIAAPAITESSHAAADAPRAAFLGARMLADRRDVTLRPDRSFRWMA